VLVHFSYGYKSLSEFVKKNDIIAIGNSDSKNIIPKWSGKYDLLQPNHELLLQ